MTIDIRENVVYLDNIAAFEINDEGKKEPVTPQGWTMYRNRIMDVDTWLETRGKRKASPSGQIF